LEGSGVLDSVAKTESDFGFEDSGSAGYIKIVVTASSVWEVEMGAGSALEEIAGSKED